MIMEEETYAADASSPATTTYESRDIKEPKSSDISTPISPTVQFQSHFANIRIEGIRIVYDAKPLCEAIKNALIQGPNRIRLAYGVRLNFMQQFQCAYNEFIENFPPPASGIAELWTEFKMEKMTLFCEMYLVRLAEMLNKCDYYAELSHVDKYLLFKHFWQAFQFFERVYATAQLCGTSATDMRLLITNEAAVDFKNKFYTMEGLPPDKVEELRRHIDPINDHSLKFLIMPIKTMKLTQYELIYLSALCLWTVHEVKGRLSENAVKLAEDMFEQCSNDMHNYYVYEERLSNYATRLAKLNKLHMICDSLIKVRKEVTTMAKIFNIFENDFMESDLMDI